MAINCEPSGRRVYHSGGAPLRASWPHHMDARLDFPAGFHPAYGRKHRLLHTCGPAMAMSRTTTPNNDQHKTTRFLCVAATAVLARAAFNFSGTAGFPSSSV